MGPCKLGACKVERVRLSRVNVRNVSLGWRRKDEFNEENSDDNKNEESPLRMVMQE